MKICNNPQCENQGQEQPDSAFYREGARLRNPCKACVCIRAKTYRIENPEKVKEAKKIAYARWLKTPEGAARYRRIKYASQQRLRAIVLQGYGARCACCGEDHPSFLNIDHIQRNGAEERKRFGQHSFLKYLRDNQFPSGYRILCWNCNLGREKHGGVCPHELERQCANVA
jgi:hypothetical protein